MSDTRPFTDKCPKCGYVWPDDPRGQSARGHICIPKKLIFTARLVRQLIIEAAPDLPTGAPMALGQIVPALEQFAQRLEQEEQQQTAFAATEGAAYAIVPHGAAEALREEGRQQERAKPLEVLQADNGDVLICYQPAGAYPASPVPFHDMRAGEQAKNAKSGEVMRRLQQGKPPRVLTGDPALNLSLRFVDKWEPLPRRDEVTTYPSAEQLREEGRREILKDVAKLDPMEQDGDRWVCTFCYPGWTEGLENVQHKPSCLWWRAQQARQTPETP